MADLVIIGGGFSGTLAAIEALNQSKRRGGLRDVVLVEKSAGQAQGGVAYSKVTAQAFHETNIAAKNMGLSAAETRQLAEDMHLDPQKVMPRRLVQTFLEAALDEAMTRKPGDRYAPASFRRVSGEAIDLVENSDSVTVKMKKRGRSLKADYVIVATGNPQQRQLPCITEPLMKDPAFRNHFVSNQWQPEDQKKIAEIPSDEPVLVVGTALSAYDAARSLLRQGHKGKIVLMSRHGLEHFQYPEKHTWQDISLPRPRFLSPLVAGDWNGAKKAAMKEFHDLTGLRVDLDAGTIEKDPAWLRVLNRRKNYMPEQVLKQWEKNLPYATSFLGKKAVGRFLKKYSSLISVLRVGAGNSICNEIKAAKARGQIKVVAADINSMRPLDDGSGIAVTYSKSDGYRQRTEYYHTVISSLGPDHDYAHIQNPLWKNILKRHFTQACEIGIGVDASTNYGDYGRLPNSKRIYAAGVSVSGENMLKNSLIGPPAFSVPGMREGIRQTADAVFDGIHYGKGRSRGFVPG